MTTQARGVLVTGASGTVGKRIVTMLVDRRIKVITASRSGGAPANAEQRTFDWLKPETHAAVLKGVSRIYLIAPVNSAHPETSMLPFLDLAQRAGVRRVVLQSNAPTPKGGPGIGKVHEAASQMFPECVALRPSWFMQNVCGTHPLALMLNKTRTLVTATGDARVAFVDAGDIARVAATLLMEDTISNDDPILTGPQSLSYGTVAKYLSDASGVPIRYDAVDSNTLVRRYEQLGLPASTAAFLKVMDTYLASGAEDRVTNAVERLIGKAARPYQEFAASEFRLRATAS